MVPVHSPEIIFGQEGRLLVGRAVMMDGVDRTLVQQQHQAEAHVGRLPHLLHCGRKQPRHALAAELGIERQRVPAAPDELLVDAGEARGGAHDAVLQLGAHLVAVAVERRQAVAGKLGGFLQDRIDRVVGGVLIAGSAEICCNPATSRSAKRISASGAV
jgi:hypothetical protein